jgi:hypothetical protein
MKATTCKWCGAVPTVRVRKGVTHTKIVHNEGCADMEFIFHGTPRPAVTA